MININWKFYKLIKLYQAANISRRKVQTSDLSINKNVKEGTEYFPIENPWLTN